MMTVHPSFKTLEEIVAETAALVRPPERLTVSQAAEKVRFLNNPGAYVGPWSNSVTPYLVEPQDTLSSQDFTGMVFAGPAQTGKTDMALNWLAHSVVYDPADMMIVQTSNTTARDFSIRRIDRLHRHSPEVGRRLIPRKDADNKFDKSYTSGMLLTLSWPTINELSGKPIPRLWLTDYDRMTQDVDGEGSPFDLARKRATTFGSFGMCAAESSPGFMVSDPKWKPTTPHEAPPTQGILSLYNRGDRRRWYWRCVMPKCGMAFEPDFSLLNYPDSEDIMEAAEMATLRCPHCGTDYSHDPMDGLPGKHEMNRNGRWIKDGMTWTREGEVLGKPIRSSIASFWLKGVAASFSSWKTIVFNYLSAVREYESTGQEEALKTTVNTDQGLPYTPKALDVGRSPQELESRAIDIGMRVVPLLGRFLIACVDIQKNRFVVQVHAICENLDIAVIDRFEIKKSNRLDEDGERFWVNPGAHAEDWRLLVREVLTKTYPLSDGSGRRMAVHLTMCDSGGKDGVTANAYAFYRWLRDPKAEGSEDEEVYGWEPNLASRFLLLKGASSPGAPRFRIEYPDSGRRDRNAGARGEIPVAFINTDTLKDQLNHMLDRVEPGGRIVFPNWLDSTFFTELTVEVKDPKKGWINPKSYRNESWDLLTYCLAGCLSPRVRLDSIRFDEPPSWAERWDDNSLVYSPAKQAKPFDAERKPRYDLSKLAQELG
jgi:phage terminase large subunit GpA-like protein